MKHPADLAPLGEADCADERGAHQARSPLRFGNMRVSRHVLKKLGRSHNPDSLEFLQFNEVDVPGNDVVGSGWLHAERR